MENALRIDDLPCTYGKVVIVPHVNLPEGTVIQYIVGLKRLQLQHTATSAATLARASLDGSNGRMLAQLLGWYESSWSLDGQCQAVAFIITVGQCQLKSVGGQCHVSCMSTGWSSECRIDIDIFFVVTCGDSCTNIGQQMQHRITRSVQLQVLPWH